MANQNIIKLSPEEKNIYQQAYDKYMAERKKQGLYNPTGLYGQKQRYEFTTCPENFDNYPNNFKCWVIVQDNKTKKVFKRRGYGKYIGNFSPIWISIGGIKKQLTEWEREII